ncbi:MAG: heme exporter protein CcmD [Proteobacteria bacterium]|nr:heme exporter protein CcmD [Pseudomonadota bacterium]MDA1308104.1 heme exporter protein CcmD [Pseudomonadota bacterium]
MGGYGAYIWPAYGIAAALMLGLLALSLRAGREQRDELAALEATGRTRRRQMETGDDAKTS